MSNSRIRLHYATLSLLFFCSMQSGCSRFYSADKFVQEAQKYEKKGDDNAALIQLKNALQKDPNHLQARIMLGELYLQLDDGFSAENEFRKAISSGTPKNKLVMQLARAMLLEGHYKNLLDETQSPGTAPAPELLSLQGLAHLYLKEPALARDAFDLALKTQPDLPSALLGLAKLAMTEHDPSNAVSYVDRSLASDPQFSEAWQFKGDILQFQSDTAGALECYDKALVINPRNFSARIAKANIEIKLKKYDAAQADINSAIASRSKNLNGTYTQAVLYFAQGKNHESLDALGIVLKSAPQYLPAILLSGTVNYALGATTQAEVFLRKFLEEVPDNTYARKMLAECQIKNGNPVLALNTLEVAIKNGHTDDSQLYALAGEAALKTRDFNKANFYFEQASAIAPDNAGIHTQLALEKALEGDNKDAISQLEKALSLNDKVSFPKSVTLLAMTYMRTGEFDKAMSTIQLLEKEQPNNPLVHNLKGVIYLNKNDSGKARTSFETALKYQPNYFEAAANLAKIDVSEKKFKEAEDRFLALLKLDKTNLYPELALAKLADMQEHGKEAEKWLTKAYEDHPKQIQAAQPLISFYLQAKEPQKALNLAKNLQASAPDNPEYLFLLAQTQQAGGDPQGSISSYTKLAALHPEAAQPQFQVALAYLNANDEAGTREALKKTLLISPTFLPAQVAMADLESRNGKFDAALNIAKRIQSQDAKNAQGYILEGDILMRQNKFIPASNAYTTALALSKSNTIVVKIHSALVKGNKAQEANNRIEGWLKDNPNDNKTRLYYATYLLANGQSKLPAITQLLAILKSDQNNPQILNNLAWAYDLEKDSNAITYAEKAYQLAGKNPQIMDTYGWILAEKGDYAKAVPLLQQSKKLMPSNSEIQYHLAYVLFKTGDKVQARKELENIVKATASPVTPDAQKLLKQLDS